MASGSFPLVSLSRLRSLRFPGADLLFLRRATAGDTPVHVHSLPSFHLYRSFNSHTSGISHVSFSADSTLLASASDDKTVRIWEIDPTLSLSHRALGVLGSEETRGDDDGGAKEEMAIRVLRGHLSAVFCVGWSPRGDLIASGGMDETVRVWDVQKGQPSSF